MKKSLLQRSAVFWSLVFGATLFTIVFMSATARADRTFYWSMEADQPDVFPEGSDASPGYYSKTDMRSEAQAHGGKHGLDLSGSAWKSAVFDNPTNNEVWAPTDQGAMVVWWMYTGEFCDSGMLMMITGKAQKTNPKLDTNDGISIRFHGDREIDLGAGWHDGDDYGTARVRYKADKPFEPGRWYRTTAKWNRNGPVTLFLQVDDQQPVTSSAKLGRPRAEAWHQLLIGNDRGVAPEGLFLDDVEVWNDFEMTQGD